MVFHSDYIAAGGVVTIQIKSVLSYHKIKVRFGNVGCIDHGGPDLHANIDTNFKQTDLPPENFRLAVGSAKH
jgi:hypothetical protein